MPTPRATEKQIRALHIIYKRLVSEGDMRVVIAFWPGCTPDDKRVAWTKREIGRIVTDPENPNKPSWKGLTLAEAGYLMDVLNGNPTRLDKSLSAEMARLGIVDQEQYFEAFCRPKTTHTKNVWTYGGRSFWQLNFRDKCELVHTLKTRQPARRAG